MLLTWTKSDGKAEWQPLSIRRFVMRHWKPEIAFLDNVVRSLDVNIVADVLYNISRSTIIHGYQALILAHIYVILSKLLWVVCSRVSQERWEDEIKVMSQIQTHWEHGRTLGPLWHLDAQKTCQEMHWIYKGVVMVLPPSKDTGDQTSNCVYMLYVWLCVLALSLKTDRQVRGTASQEATLIVTHPVMFISLPTHMHVHRH